MGAGHIALSGLHQQQMHLMFVDFTQIFNGIGYLSILGEIVASLDGFVNADLMIGKGSCFRNGEGWEQEKQGQQDAGKADREVLHG